MGRRLIRHSRPTLGDEEIAAVEAVIRSGMLSGGGKNREFEGAMAGFLGRREGIATSSGTAALHVALIVLGIGGGKEGIVPSYVCSALLNAVRYVGAVPRVVDVSPEDFNIDPVRAREAVTRRTAAIVVPHMFGFPAAAGELRSLGVPVIEDCAQSVGALCEGKKAGGIGDLAVLSFYATKMICTGEGGMLLTDDEKAAEAARDLVDYDERESDRVRFNYKMSEIAAAIGLVQLSRLEEMLMRRKKIAAEYGDALEEAAVGLPFERDGATHVYYRYVVRSDGSAESCCEAFAREAIECKRPVFKPLHEYLSLPGESFPGATEAAERAVSLPIYPALREDEIERVAHTGRRVFSGAERHLWKLFS